MYDYMEQDVLYDFDVGPIVRLLKPGTSAHDLGVLDHEDHEDKPEIQETVDEDGVVTTNEPVFDAMRLPPSSTIKNFPSVEGATVHTPTDNDSKN
jgi:hypothetical protein